MTDSNNDIITLRQKRRLDGYSVKLWKMNTTEVVIYMSPDEQILSARCFFIWRGKLEKQMKLMANRCFNEWRALLLKKLPLPDC